jgi:hypothetical protein
LVASPDQNERHDGSFGYLDDDGELPPFRNGGCHEMNEHEWIEVEGNVGVGQFSCLIEVVGFSIPSVVVGVVCKSGTEFEVDFLSLARSSLVVVVGVLG